MISVAEGRFAGAGGLELVRRSWRPAPPPRAVVVFVHGLGEHSALHAPLVERLAARAYAVEAFDARGHGLSPGQRGHFDTWEEPRGDLAALVALARREHAERPLFLLGHSAGGLTVLEYALRHPDDLAGVVACAPAVGEVGAPAWLQLLARALSHVWPTLSLDVRLDLTNLSRDPVAARAIVEDPLYHTRGSARMGAETLAAIAWTRAHAAELRPPLLILQGTEDRMTSPAGSRAFFEAAGTTDKSYRSYAGAFHDLFHETNASEVIDDVAAWLDQRS